MATGEWEHYGSVDGAGTCADDVMYDVTCCQGDRVLGGCRANPKQQFRLESDPENACLLVYQQVRDFVFRKVHSVCWQQDHAAHHSSHATLAARLGPARAVKMPW